MGDAEIDADLADGSDVAVFRPAVDMQDATEIGDGTDDEANACTAAAFEDTDLNALDWLLRVGTGEGAQQRTGGNAGKDE